MPDNLEFLAVVESLDTPEKIGNYMKENFTYKRHYFYAPSPYMLWKLREGDCNDFTTFGIFVANYHGYITYQINIWLERIKDTHYLGVYIENNKYTYSSNMAYYPIYVDTFEEVVRDWEGNQSKYQVKSYEVYDYDLNIIETGD